MAPIHQAGPNLGHGGLETAVERRDTATAGESYMHLTVSPRRDQSRQ